MTPQQQEYIQSNIDLIEEDKWENFFNNEAPKGIGGILQTAEIDFLSKMTEIPKNCFAGDLSLQSINIPNSIRRIGLHAFEDCKNLEEISMPSNSLTNIEAGAFAHCSGLESITIPDSVTSIGIGAFRSCSKLTSITIPNGVKSIAYETFEYCPSLASVTIGNSVTNIGEGAFYDCKVLKSVNFNGTIAQWGQITRSKDAFTDAPVRKVICSDGVIDII